MSFFGPLTDNADAGFPNGRRLGDDVIDTTLAIVTNGTVTSDNVEDGHGGPSPGHVPVPGPADPAVPFNQPARNPQILGA